MYNKINVALLIFLVQIMSVDAIGLSVPDIDGCIAAVTSWSERLYSFDGKYTRFSYFLYHPTEQVDPTIPTIWEVEHRFMGGNKFTSIYHADFDNLHKAAVLNGVFTELGATNTSGKYKETQYITGGWKNFYDDEDIGSPLVFFGHTTRRQQSFSDFLSRGDSRIINREGRKVLLHQDLAGNRVEFWLNEQRLLDRVINIGNLSEIFMLDAVYEGDTDDLRLLTETFEYNDYAQINGVWFPLHVRRISYTTSLDADAAFAAIATGDIDTTEEIDEIFNRDLFIAWHMMDMIFELDSIRINAPLDDDAFMIEIPEGTLVFADDGSFSHYKVTKTSYSTKIVIFVMTISIVLIVMFFLLWKRGNARIPSQTIR